MPGSLYARYVPPKAPDASTKPDGDTRAPAQDTSPQPASLPEVKQKKKEKAEKPKKRKREEKQDGTRPEDGVVPKKHQSVLAKFQKSALPADIAAEHSQDQVEEKTPSPEPELHDLVPLPQPVDGPEPTYKPTFASLPSWLAKPVTAPASAKTPFGDLNIDPKLVKHLSSKGYNETFAVQSAVLPLLLPGSPNTTADVCVSAATGSGKTLAYILPMIESLRHRTVTKLRGIVVVPTRELVTQVREAAELCSVGSGLKIGTAVGHYSFAVEQEMLVKKGRRYDPDAASELRKEADAQVLNGWVKKDKSLEDALDMLPGHVPSYESKVDLLICTPGRLVEHIQSTLGFTMDDVQWLIIDEADRLLDQSFQGWSEIVIKALENEKSAESLSAREKALSKLWYPQPKRYVRKVILSATMTRDLSKLSVLKLRRPTLVVTEGADGHKDKSVREVFDLPPTLWEAAIPVGDGSKKPLYLLNLLQQHILYDLPLETPQTGSGGDPMDVDDDSSSVSSDSSSSSESSDSDSDTDSDSDSDDTNSAHEASSGSSSSASESESESSKVSKSSAHKASPAAPAPATLDPELTPHDPTANPTQNVLLFTHNNENANRLSRLLSLLHPPYAPLIGTLTKTSSTTQSRKILRSFRTGRLRILIASDRASRGLDLPNLAHIVNYDIPTSVTGYVHRVGRTARAGMEGTAWTFFGESEAAWFWNVIGRGGQVRRGANRVERLKLEGAADAEVRARYVEALKTLKGEVMR